MRLRRAALGGAGESAPAPLIILRHRPRSDASGPHLALLGKGITFDTGGISLKPPRRMWEMKGDMSGAAAVLRAMSAVSRAGLPATVTGIVAAAENFPGPNATRPGDIFRAKNGKSVMVDSTDAEGRLVLTDALARAGEEGATHIVDIATLTGAAVRALGPGVAAILGNDSAWVGAVTAAGGEHGEVYWELPLVDEYRVELECDSADLKNIGGFNAGTITAALFLREFVPEDAIWAHLDIAGPFLVTKPWKYFPKGATGFGVRTLYETAARFPLALSAGSAAAHPAGESGPRGEEPPGGGPAQSSVSSVEIPGGGAGPPAQVGDQEADDGSVAACAVGNPHRAQVGVVDAPGGSPDHSPVLRPRTR